MRIKQIHIQNFKSLVDFKLENLPQFCAFVGPNASGKSNIFEALEFVNLLPRYVFETANLFDGGGDFINYNYLEESINLIKPIFIDYNLAFQNGLYVSNSLIFFRKNNKIEFSGFSGGDDARRAFEEFKNLDFTEIKNLQEREKIIEKFKNEGVIYSDEIETFYDNFSRIFVGKTDLVRIKQSSGKLLPDASNLSQIIGQIFQDEKKREDFIGWLPLLIPEFENIEVKKSNIDGSFEFFVYEKSSPSKPFPVRLLSDGTKNILALMAAVYQSNQPQFLCIEEPENGLHPQAIELLIEFFRMKCEEEGHHIWLNTHSQTLVRSLDAEEIILVNKVDGKTKAKQLTKEDSYGLKSDEAWLSNAFGGGVL